MMATFLLAFLLFVLLFAGIGIGVLSGRRSIRGSCGGLADNLGSDEASCPLCGRENGACQQPHQASNHTRK